MNLKLEAFLQDRDIFLTIYIRRNIVLQFDYPVPTLLGFLDSDLMSVLKLTSAEHFPGKFSKISFFFLLQAVRNTKVSKQTKPRYPEICLDNGDELGKSLIAQMQLTFKVNSESGWRILMHRAKK